MQNGALDDEDARADSRSTMLHSSMDWTRDASGAGDEDAKVRYLRRYLVAVRGLYDVQFQQKRPSAILKMKGNPFDFRTGSTFDALAAMVTPLRQSQVVDQWTALEIGMYEEAFKRCGRDFHLLAEQIPHKSVKDVIAFYYVWKRNSSFAVRKRAREAEAGEEEEEHMLEVEPDAEPEVHELIEKLRRKQRSLREYFDAARWLYGPKPVVYSNYHMLPLEAFGLQRRHYLQPSVQGSSVLRAPSAIDRWTPFEIRVFELAIECYGKEFDQIARVIRTKSCKEVISFYYLWKQDPYYEQLKRRWEKKNTFLKKAKKPEPTVQ
ncbi:TPA: hypothetical protein N0F65_007197 [Lagenidium giganteum]|uniref:SANT domain-containing protein n=1 Tax=Lagenidium giganteum TaxID=4803 RepID=A0AAV2Z5Z5_9STRA|nr:TPA: hypothetical protein N0F65_007197 [Lagenidium giganteum]